MIKELTIKNFRSIREATLELGRFTVLTGANNSGKSSVLYALQVLKNVVTNPNRSVDELLNLGFLNLAGIKEAVYRKDESLAINLKVKCVVTKNKQEVDYCVELGRKSYLYLEGFSPFAFKGILPIVFPNPLMLNVEIKLTSPTGWSFLWDGYKPVSGVRLNLLESAGNLSPMFVSDVLHEMTNLPVSEISASNITPTLRGFTKPIFNTIPLNGSIFTEDEIATHIAVDKELQAKIAHYFEKIIGKRFSVSMSPGVGFFYLQVREPGSSFTTELVNQGMGINQIIFLLAKILYNNNRFICIDEPEIHLHPALIEQFVKVLIEIAEKEDKQFLFSTHSEHWLLSMLAEVNDGKLPSEQLKVYYLQRKEQETIIEQQRVMPNGQLEGGLKNFMEAQMRLAERFFDATTA